MIEELRDNWLKTNGLVMDKEKDTFTVTSIHRPGGK
tara:strand:- start:878 stop:985 length:108 start_codon:yes stop_codon:yes gene_type:complete